MRLYPFLFRTLRVWLAGLLFLIMAPAGHGQPGPREEERPADAAIRQAAGSVYRIMWARDMGPLHSSGLEADLVKDLQNGGRAWSRESSPNLFLLSNGRVYMRMSWGACYLISNAGHYVTNEHVAAPNMNLSGHSLFILARFSPRPAILPATVLWEDKRKDLAIVKAAPPPDARPLILADPGHVRPALAMRSMMNGAVQRLS